MDRSDSDLVAAFDNLITLINPKIPFAKDGDEDSIKQIEELIETARILVNEVAII